MPQRVTIRDIARLAGVSSGTVHRALYGKKGVGDEMRARVLAIAQQQGFTPNAAASALKRGPLRIAACFPASEGESRYFYTDVWRGVREYFAEESALNLTLLEYPFAEGGQAAALAAAVPPGPPALRPDGLLTLGLASNDPAPRAALEHCAALGLPVVLACDDAPGCPRFACVQANYDTVGRLGAELLSGQLAPGSEVLLLSGDANIPSHFGVARGFMAYLAENGGRLRVAELPGYRDPALPGRLRQIMAQAPPAGALSVNSRASVLLARAVGQAGLAGRVRLVGSDVFPENIAAMQAGVMHNILYKNPRRQAYQAARLLVQRLLHPDAPPPSPAETEIEAQVLFCSGLYRYGPAFFGGASKI